MKVLWLINAPIPALCERAGLPVQVKEGWIEGLYNSLMALVREEKQDFLQSKTISVKSATQIHPV